MIVGVAVGLVARQLTVTFLAERDLTARKQPFALIVAVFPFFNVNAPFAEPLTLGLVHLSITLDVLSDLMPNEHLFGIMVTDLPRCNVLEIFPEAACEDEIIKKKLRKIKILES